MVAPRRLINCLGFILVDEHIKRGIKKSTAATYWSKLNTFFGWLAQHGYIEGNPFAKMTYPTPSYEEKKFLSRREIEKIITAIHCHHDNNDLLLKRNLVLFYLFIFCGLRRNEVLHLQIRDIDFERKVITIRGDTSKSGITRQVPLHSTLVMYLKDYLQIRKRFTTPLLLVSRNRDDGLTIEGLKRLTEKIKQVSGIQFHPHQFRHTFAVNFLKSSNNIAKLKQLLGHKDINMTLVYLRCLPVDEMRGDIEHLNIDDFI